MWRAYNGLCNENFILILYFIKRFGLYLIENHSSNFVDPETGDYTQNIERLWRELQANIPCYDTHDYHFTNYLAEFLFKRMYNFDERIDAFFEIISFIYSLDCYM